jgi:hypothetical protein
LHPLIGDVVRARRANRVVGFVVIAPWQVANLTEEWLAVLDGLSETQKAQESEALAKAAAERVFAKRRAAHPTYRKR